MAKIIGVTGGIGSGKTTVINYIKSKGFAVYIADDAGKRVMEKWEVIEKVKSIFDTNVILPNGLLDRKRIGEIVFQNKLLLEKLNNIVHPEIKLDFENFIEDHKKEKLIFKEAAILFESGSYKDCDATILITAPEDIRINRVVQRDSISKDIVLNRMKNQMPEDEKRKLSTYIVDNVDLENTYKCVDDILHELLNN